MAPWSKTQRVGGRPAFASQFLSITVVLLALVGTAATMSLDSFSVASPVAASPDAQPAEEPLPRHLPLTRVEHGVGRNLTNGTRPDAEPSFLEAPRPTKSAVFEKAPLKNIVPLSGVARLSLRFFGVNELNGEYAIDAGSMSVPTLGRFDVAEKSLHELEDYISARISEALRREIIASAEVVRYKPVFITGHVVTPGEVAWRPDLTVVQAATLAGGTSLRGGSGSDPRSDLRAAARAQLRLALTQVERLVAERDGHENFTPSKRLVELVNSRSELGDLTRRQNELLNERRRILQTQLDGLQGELNSAVNTLKSTQVQANAVKLQLDLTRELLAGTTALHSKQLVGNARYLEQRGAVAGAEVRLAEVQAVVQVGQSRVAAVERQMVTLRQQRHAEINERVETLGREVAQHEQAFSDDETAATGNSTERVLEYNIARSGVDGISTFAAGLFTKILPGDVVIVSPAHIEPRRLASGGVLSGDNILAGNQEPIRTQRFISAAASDRPGLSAAQ